jgi:hypothetical protein
MPALSPKYLRSYRIRPENFSTPPLRMQHGGLLLPYAATSVSQLRLNQCLGLHVPFYVLAARGDPQVGEGCA